MRLIDADELIRFRDDVINGKRKCNSEYDMVSQIPTVDPIHVAGGCYCYECRYEQRVEGGISYCEELQIGCIKYCSRGKRRE